MRTFYLKSTLILAGVVSLGYAINNQHIQTYTPNNVSKDPYASFNHWEPSTTAGPTWIHSYAVLPDGYSRTAAWNATSGQWTQSPSVLTTPAGKAIGDVFTGFDAFHNNGQYVLVGSGYDLTSSSLWFGTSSDGLNWSTLREVLPGKDTSADRCGLSITCRAAGDYARIASNAYLGVDSPYIDRSPFSGNNDLFQIFGFDPQGSAPKNTFTPKPVYYPMGSDLRSLGTANPPESLGVAPEQRRKIPGKNGR